jgi:hypothetical protein
MTRNLISVSLDFDDWAELLRGAMMRARDRRTVANRYHHATHPELHQAAFDAERVQAEIERQAGLAIDWTTGRITQRD